MVGKISIRAAVTGALLMIALGTIQACGKSPTAVNDDGQCVWINGQLYCN